MKRICILSVLFLNFYYNVIGQPIVWTGTASTDFFNPANWVGGIAPTGGEDILFNATGGSNNCSIGADIAVSSFSVMAGYTGIIDFGADDHFIDNDFVVNSGTVIGTSSQLSMPGNGKFLLGSSGTYSTNGGGFGITNSPGQTFTFSGDIVLDLLEISTGINGSQRNVDFGSNLTVEDIIISSGTNANRPISYQGTIHIKNSLELTGTSTAALTNNTARFIFDGPAAVITGPSAALRIPLPNIEINTAGNVEMHNHINVTGNWTGTQGSLDPGTSTVNMYGSGANIAGTAAAFHNFYIRTGANVSLPPAEVLVAETLTRDGTLSFQPATILGLNGSGNQTISGSSITLAGIHAYSNGGSRNVTMSTPVAILDFLQVDAGVTFASGGNVTLRSTNALTARVGQLGAGASITGNVTVETLIPGGTTDWATLGIRGVTGQNIQHWDTHQSSGGVNGIPMTCNGCSFGVDALPGTSSFHSIQGWDEPNNDYDTLLTAGSPLTPGKGFWVYVGDGPFGTSDLRVINTGNLVQGNVNVPVSTGSSGFNLVANPYASPISWRTTFDMVGSNPINFNDAIYAYSAEYGGYTEYVGHLANPGAPAGIDDVIAGGQGFFVEATHGATHLEFDESVKVDQNTAANPLVKTAAVNVGQTFRLKLNGSNDWNATAFRFHPDATIAFDKKFDAHKIFQNPGYVGYEGPYSKLTTISSKDPFNEDYGIQSLPPLTRSLSVPILARVSTSGTYTISAYDFKDFTACVGLVDRLDNSYHDLRKADYVFTINDTTSTPRFDLILCKDERIIIAGIPESNSFSTILINQDQQGAYVKTAFPDHTKATISAYNIIGQKLMADVTVEGKANITHLNLNLHNQIVLIKVTTDHESVSKKIVLH